jgi:L-lactate permease
MPAVQFTFTPEDARILYAFIASVLVPFAVQALSRPDWTGGKRVLLAIAVSLLGGALSVYFSGTFTGPASALALASAVFAASQAHYTSWFKSVVLGLPSIPPAPGPVDDPDDAAD